MRLLLGLCLILVIVTVPVIPSPIGLGAGLTCSEQDHGNVCTIEGLALDSAAPPDDLSFPDSPGLYLNNCTIQDFSPQLLEKLPSSTEKLFILDGYVPKVHLKPTLKSFTALRAATAEIAIDPVDNHQLELLDIEGHLTSIPDNVHHLKKLVTLDLCQNQILSWNANQLEGLDRLRKLNLGHNQIQSVVSTSQVNLPALRELFLHGNKISTLDLSHMKADHLERLYLSQNQLIRIEGFPGRYNQLRRVDLFQNEWDCSWLGRTLELLRGAGVETMSYLPKGVCDERGSIKLNAISCGRNSTDA